MYTNWLCSHCPHYRGMEKLAAPMEYTRCGNPAWQKHFERGKDYLLHYATAQPNWCREKVDF